MSEIRLFYKFTHFYCYVFSFFLILRCKPKLHYIMNKKIFTATFRVLFILALILPISCGSNSSNSISSTDSISCTDENHTNAIDLGLPSGTMWADRNVGADSPEDYGDYFAWGETEPKSVYDWITYKWCNGGYDKLTKYCTDSSCGYNGFTDNKTTLEPSDDAATANLGEEWCMPTEEQINELIKKCTWTVTTQNGVEGYKVSGPNGNFIFLPAAGYFDGSEYVDTFGYYWSSSLDESVPGAACVLSFYSNLAHELYLCPRDCYNGFVVRAVVH